MDERIREGNPGRRPLPEHVSVGGVAVPEDLRDPPEHVGNDGREWWAETVPLAARSGLLDVIDKTQLTFMAVQMDRWVKAQRVLAEDGYFVAGSVGQLRPHPAIKISNDAEVQFSRLAEAFGFNPMSRTRLGLQALKGAAALNDLNRTLDGEAEGDGGDGGGFVDGSAVDVGLPGI